MEQYINSQTIPAWLVATLMLLTGLMWIIVRKNKIELDYRTFAFTYILEGLVYGVLFQIFNVDIEIRGFYSRLMLVILCLCQYIPLTIYYIRSRVHGS